MARNYAIRTFWVSTHQKVPMDSSALRAAHDDEISLEGREDFARSCVRDVCLKPDPRFPEFPVHREELRDAGVRDRDDVGDEIFHDRFLEPDGLRLDDDDAVGDALAAENPPNARPGGED